MFSHEFEPCVVRGLFWLLINEQQYLTFTDETGNLRVRYQQQLVNAELLSDWAGERNGRLGRRSHNFERLPDERGRHFKLNGVVRLPERLWLVRPAVLGPARAGVHLQLGRFAKLLRLIECLVLPPEQRVLFGLFINQQ